MIAEPWRLADYLDHIVEAIERIQRYTLGMAVSALTHYQDVARQGCAVWCLVIRHAVLNGEFPVFADIRDHVPDAGYWAGVLADAEQREPREFAQHPGDSPFAARHLDQQRTVFGVEWPDFMRARGRDVQAVMCPEILGATRLAVTF